ncbi:MAG: hypothetical protein PVJ55_12625 [Anaerolineae bacterium]|jgi:hypothetical protein
MTDSPQRYHSYLLRLWQANINGESVWRASLESHSGERQGFADLESLFAFLEEQTGDYEVELTVHDGQVGSVPDRVTVHVTGPGTERSCLYLPLLLRRGP